MLKLVNDWTVSMIHVFMSSFPDFATISVIPVGERCSWKQ